MNTVEKMWQSVGGQVPNGDPELIHLSRRCFYLGAYEMFSALTALLAGPVEKQILIAQLQGLKDELHDFVDAVRRGET
jgi:hypothetical protein